MRRVCVDGTTGAGRILIDGKLWSTLEPTTEEHFTSKPFSDHSNRDIEMLHVVADALEKYLEGENERAKNL